MDYLATCVLRFISRPLWRRGELNTPWHCGWLFQPTFFAWVILLTSAVGLAVSLSTSDFIPLFLFIHLFFCPPEGPTDSLELGKYQNGSDNWSLMGCKNDVFF